MTRRREIEEFVFSASLPERDVKSVLTVRCFVGQDFIPQPAFSRLRRAGQKSHFRRLRRKSPFKFLKLLEAPVGLRRVVLCPSRYGRIGTGVA